MTVYRFIVFLHVISALGFIMAHGVNAMMLFKVSRERQYENLCNYLDISKSALKPAFLALHGVELTGIVLTIWAGWYRMAWIWISLALFFVIGFVMVKYAAGYMNSVRSAMGMVSEKDLKKGIRPAPFSEERLMQAVAQGKPKLVAAVGLGGMAAIVFLMVVKPF